MKKFLLQILFRLGVGPHKTWKFFVLTLGFEEYDAIS